MKVTGKIILDGIIELEGDNAVKCDFCKQEKAPDKVILQKYLVYGGWSSMIICFDCVDTLSLEEYLKIVEPWTWDKAHGIHR